MCDLHFRDSKTMKKYLQSTEVKDWMRFKRHKAVQMIHPEEKFKSSFPSNSVSLDCHPFSKHRNHNKAANQNERQKKMRENGVSSNREVGCLFTKPETSPQLGRFKNRTTATRAKTTVGCETLTTTLHLPPNNTECSSRFFYIQDSEGIITRRPMLRRELTCSALIEEVKRQRALNAKLELRKRERQAMHIVSVRSRSRNESRIALRNENKGSKETLRKNRFQQTRLILKEEEGLTRRSYEVGPQSLTEKRTVATARDATAILQGIGECHPESLNLKLTESVNPNANNPFTHDLADALEALECAHRWNEWGARTLSQLARASKAATDRKLSSIPWKPKLLLPHDKDIPNSRHGRILKSREEERVLIRDLIVTSNLTNTNWLNSEPIVNRRLLKLRLQTEQEEKKEVIDRRILCDFVEELLRHEQLMRSAGICLRREQEQYPGQALVQKIWNNLQVLPSPLAASSTGICATVQLILEQDFKASKEPTLLELCEVERELEDMIFENLVQELLEEITALRRD